MMTSNESSDAKLRVVVDTSVFIAAILKSGLSEDVLRIIYQGGATLYYSKDIITELKQKLSEKPFTVDSARANEALKTIIGMGRPVLSVKVKESKLRDQDDIHVLECAVAAEANLIITLDQDLIKLKSFQNIGIIHPKTFRWMVTEK